MTGLEEWKLVRRWQSGDRGAFEGLYRLHGGRIYALCLRMTRRGADAEEVTQEVFTRAWQYREAFRTPGHFEAWIRRVAVNLVINQRRALARHGAPESFDEEQVDHPSSEPGPEAAAPRVDLERAIDDLPAGSRTVFLLHDVYGYRHQEIADITGVAIGTTKSQLHRARRRLREVLNR